MKTVREQLEAKAISLGTVTAEQAATATNDWLIAHIREHQLEQHRQALRGGSRPGAGRKPGKDWKKGHQLRIYTSIGFDPDNYHWLKSEAEARGTTMAALVNEAVAAFWYFELVPAARDAVETGELDALKSVLQEELDALKSVLQEIDSK